MKKSKLIIAFALIGFASSIYGTKIQEVKINPYVGYWVQFSEEKNDQQPKVQGIIHSKISTENNNFGMKDTLQLSIVLPIMRINDENKIIPPLIKFEKGNKVKLVSGSINGFNYNYTSDNSNFLQGLIFAGNLQKQHDGTYDQGGVLNPNDGKTYSANAKLSANGENLYVRAYYGWFGKDAHWKKITEKQFNLLKEKCGLTKDNVYPYQDKDGKLIKNELFKYCYNYDFNLTK